jgi:cyclopropane-fatty-acyl-phospholipid synthase
MATELALACDPALETSLAILGQLADGYGPRDFAVRFWDGATWDPAPGQPVRFTLVLNHAGALRKMFWTPDPVAFGEAYIYDDFDVEGDMLSFMRFCRHLQDSPRSPRQRLRLGWQLFRLPSQGRPHLGRQPVRLRGRKRSLERDRQATAYAYDTSNDFYALWLDENLVYSCAYFRTAEDNLEDAQRRKLDYICHKLRLRSGERLLDIGCGWGALVMHAARHYGVEAVGATLSRKQAELSTDRIRRARLEGRCRVEYRDYREIQGPEEFDKIASVGMVEHLGEAMLPTFFRGAWKLLRPGGVFLHHAISRPANVPAQRWRTFARKYVFPDGELQRLNVTLREAELAGFEVRDVESLREHYTLTLDRWLRQLEEQREKAVALVGETTYRVFRLYLAGAQNGMRLGMYNIYQSLLTKPAGGEAGLPLTRADWYA